jgi:outer membrane protein TolC
VSLKQPLLQYRGINPQLLQERQAGLSVQLAEVAQALTRLDVLTDAQHAYWVWQEARNTLLIQQQLVTLASQRVAQVESRATKGDLPLVDVLEAKQTLQRRQVARTKATESLLKQGYQLLWFLWPTTDQWPTLATQLTQLEMPPLQSQWLTYTMPKVVQPTAVTENVLHALLHRPELEQQALTKQLKTLDLSLAKTQLLPKLDAIISPGYQVGANGIGGTLKAGLSFSVPLRNRTALGKVRLATVDLATVDVKTQMLLQDIHLKLETLAMQWQQGWQQAQQAYEAWQQSEALAVAERRRFELGDSTLFLLNRRESDAAMAQESWLQAFVDTQHTLVELQRVMGTVQR